MLLTINKHDKTQLLPKLKKILFMGFRATLNLRKFKVALNPMYRIFFNFAKSCILSCLSKFGIKKKFHRAVFEVLTLKPSAFEAQLLPQNVITLQWNL